MVLFPGDEDLAYMKEINKETHILFFPEIKLYKRIIRREEKDMLYGEEKDAIYHPNAIYLPVFVDYKVDRRRLLGLFGKDEERDLIFWCSEPILDEMELTIVPGDVFVVEEVEFTVQEVSYESHVVNQEIYLERGYATMMRRGSSIFDDRIDDTINVPDYTEGELGQEPMLYDPLYPED